MFCFVQHPLINRERRALVFVSVWECGILVEEHEVGEVENSMPLKR